MSGQPSDSAHLFARLADEYRRYRPEYPAELFRALAHHAPSHALAWDCACGSGQASLGLAAHFARVIATDLRVEPLRRAPRTARISYAAASAEASCVRTAAAGCVVVAQALHWLDLERFYREVERVLVPGGVFAAWAYALPAIDAAIDPLMRELYDGALAPWWTAQRRTVDDGYRSVPFPFDPIPIPPIELRVRWTFEELVGHLETWSAVQRARDAGTDPLADWLPRVRALWGDASVAREVRWPLGVRAGRKREPAA